MSRRGVAAASINRIKKLTKRSKIVIFKLHKKEIEFETSNWYPSNETEEKTMGRNTMDMERIRLLVADDDACYRMQVRNAAMYTQDIDWIRCV